MRNFGLMVKMMVMALVFGALFCSCNVAGGSDSYDSAASRASSLSASNAEGQPVSVTLKLPSVKVSITGPEMVEINETAIFTAKASEGAILSWYVNGTETGETGTTCELNLSQPGLYDITCVAISADYTMCKSASTYIVVNP